MPAYRSLAEVYEFLTPDALLTPEGAVAAFAPWLPPAGARVLDCACGIGLLAVGLARAGYDVRASDASPEMVRRTRAHGVAFPASVCRWEDLPPTGDADAVLCVGNALPHARDRVAALRGMAGVLRPGGLLVLTTRTWERPQPDERAEVERGGRRAVVTSTWSPAPGADGSRTLEVAVALAGRTVTERLTFWPVTRATLLDEMRAAGIEPAADTWAPGAARHLVTGRRR